MAPKKKKKSKAEIEAEKLRLEEEAKRAEEERIRLEEEERKRKEEEEKERARLTALHLQQEAEAIENQRQKLQEFFGDLKRHRDEAKQVKLKQQEWDRYCQASHLPDPVNQAHMNGYFTTLEETKLESLNLCLQLCEDMLYLIRDGEVCEMEALQESEDVTVQQLLERRKILKDYIQKCIDQTTAFVLQHSDRYANENGDILVGDNCENFAVCFWVNVAKNPRFKLIEMKPIGENFKVEITKQISLANIALRVQHRNYDEFYSTSENGLMAVGGIFYVEMLSLPLPYRTMGDWTLRSAGSASQNLENIPYPIPPAGVDIATYRSTEEPPPLTFTLQVKQPMLLLQDENCNYPQVGWWDAQNCEWSTQGISNISLDEDTGVLQFQSVHIGRLAIVQSRVGLFPYLAWKIRPTSGIMGSTVSLALELPWPHPPMEFSVGGGYVQLLSPLIPQFEGLKGKRFEPRVLLLQLLNLGINLMPTERDSYFIQNICYKNVETEQSMCEDLALLSGSFLISESRFNSEVDCNECVARISEIVDWEDGGRTELKHADRIFSKEKETGPSRILCVMRRGVKGVTFCNALDKASEFSPLPGYDTLEYEESIYGEIHCSLVSLIQGSAKESNELWQNLQALPETVEQVRRVEPLMTQSLSQLLMALRIFSFC